MNGHDSFVGRHRLAKLGDRTSKVAAAWRAGWIKRYGLRQSIEGQDAPGGTLKGKVGLGWARLYAEAIDCRHQVLGRADRHTRANLCRL